MDSGVSTATGDDALQAVKIPAARPSERGATRENRENRFINLIWNDGHRHIPPNRSDYAIPATNQPNR